MTQKSLMSSFFTPETYTSTIVKWLISTSIEEFEKKIFRINIFLDIKPLPFPTKSKMNSFSSLIFKSEFSLMVHFLIFDWLKKHHMTQILSCYWWKLLGIIQFLTTNRMKIFFSPGYFRKSFIFERLRLLL